METVRAAKSKDHFILIRMQRLRGVVARSWKTLADLPEGIVVQDRRVYSLNDVKLHRISQEMNRSCLSWIFGVLFGYRREATD